MAPSLLQSSPPSQQVICKIESGVTATGTVAFRHHCAVMTGCGCCCWYLAPPAKGDVFCAAEEDGPAEELGSLSGMSAPELGEDEFVEIQVRLLLPCRQES